MCLAVPGKIIKQYTSQAAKMGKVDFGGVIREVCLEAVPEAELGQYVIVHAGFALSVLSEEEANATLEAFKELDMIEAEFYPDPPVSD